MAPDLPPTKHIDTSRWPLISYTAPAEVSDDEMREVMRESATLRALGQLHALLLDVRATSSLTPVQRKMITDSMGENPEMQREITAGVALVFSSPILRGILTAIYWVRPAVVPTRVFATPDAAATWLLGELHKRQQTASAA